ncbi:MAG: DUF1499 domain-containing protein [Congregibacter sp.]
MTDTTSRWIRWPGYLAWIFLALIPLSIMMVRSGNWQQGLGLYALAGLLSLGVLAWFAVQSLIPRFSEQRGVIFKRALAAVPGSVLLLMVFLGPKVPAIHDITTDTENPPQFEKAQSLRGDSSNPIDIKPEVIEIQREAYPDLATLQSPRSYASSFSAALATAKRLGWEITHEDVNAGFIEAVDTTAIMNFKDDIVIRIRTNEDGSLVDLRSVSRVGRSDLGANAKRIKAFMAAFAETAATQ